MSDFDLERAVAAWRQRLLGEGLDPEHVDELEDHLRESTARLRVSGLETQSAFERAAHR